VTKVILASASPARLQLLKSAGIFAEVKVSGVNEELPEFLNLPPIQMVEALAKAKAQAVASSFDGDHLIIGADSTLEFDGKNIGKPATSAEAISLWNSYRNKSGILYTGQVVIDTSNGAIAERVSATKITFANISDEEIDAYVKTGEPLQVAGGATLDGIGSAFISRIEGDATGVIGLSMPVLFEMVTSLGHSWHKLRQIGSAV
jgi:septum formation protein